MWKKLFGKNVEQEDTASEYDLLDSTNIPKHIAIIMDGNGRWAKQKGGNRLMGHKTGADSVNNVVEAAVEVGVKYLTLYAFSTENWKRAEDEVKALMMLLQNYLDEYSKRADTENIRVKILGDITALSEGMQKSIKRCMERTKDNTGVTFNIALNYGGRDELIKAIKQISAKVKNQEIDIEEISEKLVSDNLYTKGQPDPDLLIRTSGELRLSNFLPWQLVYSEFLFLDKNWPDFEEEDLDKAIIEYQKRTRKFGAN